jgi:hypothetical protein
MAKKEFYAIVDTETTINDHVFDIAIIIVDRKGEIHKKMAVLVNDFINEDLFYDNNNGAWSKQIAVKKRAEYEKMINDGRRIIASVNSINRWIDKAIAEYNPILTAYNVAFDSDKCQKSGIDLNGFKSRFCLWHTAAEMFGNSKNFKAFALENHYFGNRTKNANMVIKTNAEVMAHFVTGNNIAEPHTALEDAQFFELPILQAIVNKKGWKNKINKPFNWQNFVVKNHFKAK